MTVLTACADFVASVSGYWLSIVVDLVHRKCAVYVDVASPASDLRGGGGRSLRVGCLFALLCPSAEKPGAFLPHGLAPLLPLLLANRLGDGRRSGADRAEAQLGVDAGIVYLVVDVNVLREGPSSKERHEIRRKDPEPARKPAEEMGRRNGKMLEKGEAGREGRGGASRCWRSQGRPGARTPELFGQGTRAPAQPLSCSTLMYEATLLTQNCNDTSRICTQNTLGKSSQCWRPQACALASEPRDGRGRRPALVVVNIHT